MLLPTLLTPHVDEDLSFIIIHLVSFVGRANFANSARHSAMMGTSFDFDLSAPHIQFILCVDCRHMVIVVSKV